MICFLSNLTPKINELILFIISYKHIIIWYGIIRNCKSSLQNKIKLIKYIVFIEVSLYSHCEMEQFVKASSTSTVAQHKKEIFIEKIQFSHGKRGKNSLNKFLIIPTFSLSLSLSLSHPNQNLLLLFSLSESNPSTFPIPFNKLQH